jgi:hypothetical protein
MGVSVGLSMHGGLQSVRPISVFGFAPALEQFGLEPGMFAYSLRQVIAIENTVVSSEGQPLCMRVRRDNDNTEQDIGFSNGNLDTAALEEFCEGGASAYVKIWYNQVANAFGTDTKHFAAASNTQQPPIVENGSVLTDPVTGLPRIRFSGERYLQYTETEGNYADSSSWAAQTLGSFAADYSVFFVGQSYRVTGNSYILQSSNDNVVLLDNSLSYVIDSTSTSVNLPNDGFTNPYVWEIERDGSNKLGLYKNNTDLIGYWDPAVAGTFGIQDLGGTGASTRSFNGDVFEFFGYPSSQSQRNDVFANLDEYYTITDYAHTPTTYATPFAARVAADGGSVESTSCLITDLTPLV